MNDEPEYKLDDSVDERQLLFRMSRELVSIRRLIIEVIGYIRDAESEIPESLRRFGNYMHDIHDIKYMYEEHGQPPPQHIYRELERCDDRYRQILKEMHEEGGALARVRQKMAEDSENRWDHTRKLDFKGRSEGQ